MLKGLHRDAVEVLRFTYEFFQLGLWRTPPDCTSPPKLEITLASATTAAPEGNGVSKVATVAAGLLTAAVAMF